jgi:RNA polymerase primary sigma factor
MLLKTKNKYKNMYSRNTKNTAGNTVGTKNRFAHDFGTEDANVTENVNFDGYSYTIDAPAKLFDTLIEDNIQKIPVEDIEISDEEIANASEVGNKDYDSLEFHFREMEKNPLLSIEQERELYPQLNAGGKIAERARHKLILSNLRLVVAVAKKYAKIGDKNSERNSYFADLIQEGNLALSIAAEKFDSTKGAKFSTYAMFYIKHFIRCAVAGKIYNIRVPEYRFGKETIQYTTSVDAPLSNDPDAGTLLDIYADTAEDDFAEDPLKAVMKKELYAKIHEALNKLSPREKSIIIKRFGFNEKDEHTLDEIGKSIGRTRERARQIVNEILKKITPELAAFLKQ